MTGALELPHTAGGVPLSPANGPMIMASAAADSDLRAGLADLVGSVHALRVEVAELRAAVRSPPTPPRLLSLSAAARALGVSRNATLHDLIRDRRIRTVPVNGKKRIPSDEIERIAREGTGTIRPVARNRVQAPRSPPLARDLV